MLKNLESGKSKQHHVVHDEVWNKPLHWQLLKAKIFEATVA
jgi:hypothetical protein